VARSTDGGRTWADLSKPLNILSIYETPLPSAPLTAPGGRLLALEETWDDQVSHNGAIVFLSDNGVQWHAATAVPLSWASPRGSLPDARHVVLSPMAPDRIYAVRWSPIGAQAPVVSWSDDGATWHDGGTPPNEAEYGGADTISLVADPLHRDTVYANAIPAYLLPDDLKRPAITGVARSDDAGSTWQTVTSPTESPALDTFRVELDPHERGLLVGRTDDPSIPANRRYLSADAGRTWRTSVCPGAAGDACPRFTVDNVFGAGASYAVYDDGIYVFHGAGPAEHRLALSTRLPVAATRLQDIAAGGRMGDPIYLLASGGTGTQAAPVDGLLYRSDDGGRSWHQLAAGILPTLVPASRAAGTLFVPQTHHSVGRPFVALYRRLGLLMTGYPITEVYLEGRTLTQDFERVRMELSNGHATLAPLGQQELRNLPQTIAFYGGCLDDPNDPFNQATPEPSTATSRYFPQTHRAVQGDLLRFWQSHGGPATLGLPITRVVTADNGDGSNRAYEMQWFQNMRLERHPELHNRRYAILPGLLGKEVLYQQGWLPAYTGGITCPMN
jgi:hypothetical protein